MGRVGVVERTPLTAEQNQRLKKLAQKINQLLYKKFGHQVEHIVSIGRHTEMGGSIDYRIWIAYFIMNQALESGDYDPKAEDALSRAVDALQEAARVIGDKMVSHYCSDVLDK